MAILFSKQTGNWLTAATWGLVDATSFARSETNQGTVPTSAGAGARSAGFTPGAITIDGIAVRLRQRSGTTGTMTVRLWNNTDSVLVTGATCTINVSDLPVCNSTYIEGGWIMFAFAYLGMLGVLGLWPEARALFGPRLPPMHACTARQRGP